ncbi:MAG: hypothetical protein L0G99_13895, partial [Propionibacteriales bacterium]|nr:hypothetical protein [Propionibacteriales bacterium]
GEAGPQPATGPTPWSGSSTDYLNGGGEQVVINHGRDYSDIPSGDLRPNPDGTYPQWSIGRSAWA